MMDKEFLIRYLLTCNFDAIANQIHFYNIQCEEIKFMRKILKPIDYNKRKQKLLNDKHNYNTSNNHNNSNNNNNTSNDDDFIIYPKITGDKIKSILLECAILAGKYGGFPDTGYELALYNIGILYLGVDEDDKLALFRIEDNALMLYNDMLKEEKFIKDLQCIQNTIIQIENE